MILLRVIGVSCLLLCLGAPTSAGPDEDLQRYLKEVVTVEYRVEWLVGRVPNYEDGVLNGEAIPYFRDESDVIAAIKSSVADEETWQGAKTTVRRLGVIDVSTRREVHRRVDSFLRVLAKVKSGGVLEYKAAEYARRAPK